MSQQVGRAVPAKTLVEYLLRAQPARQSYA